MARTGPPNAVAAPPTPRARRSGAIALVLAPAVCLIAYPSVVSQMAGEADYPSHIEFARQLAETGAMLPHFGYHTMVIVVQALTPADWVAAAGIVTLGDKHRVMTSGAGRGRRRPGSRACGAFHNQRLARKFSREESALNRWVR